MHENGAERNEACALCGRPFVADEPMLLLMRDGEVAARYHERCHPNARRSGCGGCQDAGGR